MFSPFDYVSPVIFFYFLCLVFKAADRGLVGGLDPSRTAKAGRYLGAAVRILDYNGNISGSAKGDHLGHGRFVFEYVYILYIVISFGVILTGRRRIWSRIFAEDQDLVFTFKYAVALNLTRFVITAATWAVLA